jgi:hypothetical protein
MATSWLLKDAMSIAYLAGKANCDQRVTWSPIARERVVPNAASAWYIIVREMTHH